MSSQRFTAWVMVLAFSAQVLPLHVYAQEVTNDSVSEVAPPPLDVAIEQTEQPVVIEKVVPPTDAIANEIVPAPIVGETAPQQDEAPSAEAANVEEHSEAAPDADAVVVVVPSDDATVPGAPQENTVVQETAEVATDDDAQASAADAAVTQSEPVAESVIETAIQTPADTSQADAPSNARTPRADLANLLGKTKEQHPAPEPFVRDEVLVKFKEKHITLATDAGASAARAFAAAQNLDVDSFITASNIVVLRTRDGETVPHAIARLRWIPEVLHAQPNFVYQSLSNDPRFDDLWALQSGVMNAATAWTKSEGSGVIVAVIDSGVAFNHPDLQANMWDGAACTGVDLNGAAISGGCTHGFDFEDNDPNPLPTSSSHGTHVAGTVAAVKDNATGVVGVSPQAKIMALKGSATTDQSIAAIRFAEANHADVINASWGKKNINGVGGELSEIDSMLKEAIEQFSGVFVAAAGNGKNFGDENIGDIHGDEVEVFPCDFDVDNIICVAATDEDDKLATLSDYGARSVDVGAPGKNILSTIPDDTTLFSEDFESVVPPSVGSDFSAGNADAWFSFTFSDGDTKLVAMGEGGDTVESSSVTSSTIDLSDNSNGSIEFAVGCSARTGDLAALQFWGGTKWDLIAAFLGEDEKARTTSYSISKYGNADFKFRIVWFDFDVDDDPSICLFDDFVVTVFDDGSSARYAYSQGTSMAAPHVAGVAALVKGYNKNLKDKNVTRLTAAKQNEIVKKIIMEEGDDLSEEDRAKIAEGKGKRVNAAKALNVFAPRVGRRDADDDVELDVVESQERPPGNHDQKIAFSVRDGIARLPMTLKQFEYSVDGGVTWQAPTNGDASLAMSAAQSPGDWRDNDYVSVTEFPDVATETIILNIAHADLVGLVGAEQNDVRVRFKANDGAVDSPFAVSAAFAVDLLAPTAVLAGTPATLTAATGATVTVSGDDAVTYKYSLDGDAFSPVTPIAEPIVISGLTDGAHTLRVVATDDDDNVQVEAAATTFTWTVDTTPGTALLTSKPDARTNATGATFVIGGEDVATYTYVLDGGPVSEPAAVAVPVELTDLADGSHTIAVTGIDALGNIQASATTYTWVIDTSAAVPTIGGVPANLTSATSATLTIGGEDVILYRFSLDGGAFGDETPVATPIALSGLTNGAHTVAVIGRDSVGNWQAEINAVTVTWTVDTIAPTLTETTPVATPTNDTTPGLTITVEDGAAWEVLRGEAVLASGTGTGAAQSVVLSELTDGIYTLTLAATDAVGNRATLTLESFVVDTASPTGISLRDIPASPTNVTTATITVVAGDDVVAYRFSLDGSAFGDETPVATPITLTGLADGAHTLRVIGKDAAGNVMPESIAATATWTVDTVPPTTTLANLPRAETPATVASITIGGAGVVAYRFSLDGSAFGDETPVATPITLTGLADGAHTLRVIGKDAAGNLQDEASTTMFSWVVDRSLAVPPTANPSSGVLSKQQQIHFSAPLAENMHYVYEDPEKLSCTTGSSMDTEGELFVDRAMTIHVVACYAGGVPSAVTSFTYTFATSGGGGGGGGGGVPSFIFSPPAATRAVESSAPAVVPAAPAIAVTPVALGGQVLGAREFASGTLLRVDRRELFLLEGTVLHKIPSSKVTWRYRDRERIDVTRTDVTGYTIGISVLDLHALVVNARDPQTVISGTLLRVDGEDIFLVEGTTLRKVPNLEVLWRYRNRERIEVRAQVLDRFPIGAPLT